MKSENVKIILVHPRNPLNIGGAARAMANFGFSELAVVEPFEPAWREAVSAVGAEDLMKQAKVYACLADALSGCHRSFALTTAHNRTITGKHFTLPELAETPDLLDGSYKTAFVFGSEKTGLSAEDIDLCTAALTIPTAARQPSMNLNQAVAVCCYELSKTGKPLPSRRHTDAPPSTEELGVAAEKLQELSVRCGFLRGVTKQERLTRLRHMLESFRLSAENTHFVTALAARIIVSLNGNQKGSTKRENT